MKYVSHVIFRYLTNADFFNINKPPGMEEGGGGQTYIDFPTTKIAISRWQNFLKDVSGTKKKDGAQGPIWICPVYSLGASSEGHPQFVTIYQRRANSVSIGSQRITSSRGNRIHAWHPTNGFPEPVNPKKRDQLPSGLVVYLARTEDNEIWAGWFRNSSSGVQVTRTINAMRHLREMFEGKQEGDAGIIEIGKGTLVIDATDSESPFTTEFEKSPRSIEQKKMVTALAKSSTPVPSKKNTQTKTKSEEELTQTLFEEDSALGLPADVIEKLVKIRVRNQKASKALKELYGHTCQVTGIRFTFKKLNGLNYTEAHHLVPLGKGGADDPQNIIVVSAHIHRMLHYADVSFIDLSNIKHLVDGTAYLDIEINDEPYRIKWHKEHAKRVLEYK